MQTDKKMKPSLAARVLFGVILPLLAVVLDPVVFRGEAYFSSWTAAGYLLVLVGVSVIGCWLVRSKPGAVLAGMLAACGMLSFALGVLLLPLTLVGTLLFGFGLLGLIPFATAYVFVRSALDAGRASLTRRGAWISAGLAALTVPLLMLAGQLAADRLLDEAEAMFVDRPLPAQGFSRALIHAAEPLGLRRKVLLAWVEQKDTPSGPGIAAAYQAWYGSGIERDAALLFD